MTNEITLYKKYRPDSFDFVVGNKDTVEYLQTVCEDEKVPHCILLSGPSGCGKTTLGRIIKDRLGCGKLDFAEINTADFRGVESAREIIKQSHYPPADGPSRVYIIDECHQLTKDAQNALLKVLEDTPDYLYFILCTTDPNKLLPTIISRSIQLKVQPLTEKEMRFLLMTIIKREKKKIAKGLIAQIHRDSFGRPREAINILDQVLPLPLDKQKKAALRIAEEFSESIELCRVLISGQGGWKKVSNILKGLKDSEPESIRRHVLGYAQSVLLNGGKQEAAVVIEEFWEPFYDVGFAGLVFACYSVMKG